MAVTKDFSKVIRDWLSRDPALAREVEEEFFNAEIAEAVYNARIEAGLTQKELARLIDSHQSVIARLENADYYGHSLSMLKRIADALSKRLRVEFCENSYLPRAEGTAAELAMNDVQWQSSTWEPEIRIGPCVVR